MDSEDLPRQEYCNDCEKLVTAEDEEPSNFYCDCGNEWTEGEQDIDDEDDDENDDEQLSTEQKS